MTDFDAPPVIDDEPTETDTLLAHFAVLNARLDDDSWQHERAARLDMLAGAKAYFRGEHRRPLRVKPGEHDDTVIINHCRSVINKSVAWLFGDPERGEMLEMELPKADADDAAQTGDDEDDDARPDDPARATTTDAPAVEQAEAYLQRVWRENGHARLLQKIGRRGAIGGHGFLKVLPVGDPGNPLDVPRLVLLKSELIFILTREDDTDTPEAYVIEWREKRRAPGGFRDVTVRQIVADVDGTWIIGAFEDRGVGPEKWLPVGGPEIWPYGWCPIVDWQNLPDDEGVYGLSDLEDLTGLNDAINFAASNIARIMFIHGHPRTIGIGFDASDLQAANVDSLWVIPDPNAKVQNLEMQSDLGSFFAFMQVLTQAFWDIGRELDVTSLQERIGQVTNFGLRTLANAALSKLGEKRLTYGEALNRVNRILLELGGFEAMDTVLHWRNPLPEDDTEETERLERERAMEIVSKQTAAEERGRDWEVEEERLAREREAAGNVGAALLESFERDGGMPLPRRRPAAWAKRPND